MYFVYLPQIFRYTDTPLASPFYMYKEEVLTTVRQLGIPIIDFSEVLNKKATPINYFPHRTEVHYTPAGYSLLADQVHHYLLDEGFSK